MSKFFKKIKFAWHVAKHIDLLKSKDAKIFVIIYDTWQLTIFISKILNLIYIHICIHFPIKIACKKEQIICPN